MSWSFTAEASCRPLVPALQHVRVLWAGALPDTLPASVLSLAVTVRELDEQHTAKLAALGPLSLKLQVLGCPRTFTGLRRLDCLAQELTSLELQYPSARNSRHRDVIGLLQAFAPLTRLQQLTLRFMYPDHSYEGFNNDTDMGPASIDLPSSLPSLTALDLGAADHIELSPCVSQTHLRSLATLPGLALLRLRGRCHPAVSISFLAQATLLTSLELWLKPCGYENTLAVCSAAELSHLRHLPLVDLKLEHAFVGYGSTLGQFACLHFASGGSVPVQPGLHIPDPDTAYTPVALGSNSASLASRHQPCVDSLRILSRQQARALWAQCRRRGQFCEPV